MAFGGQSVTLRSITYGARGRLGIKSESYTDTVVAGCLFRPVGTIEPTGANVDTITATFKVTLPPAAVALAADETYQLVYGGTVYEIVEVKHHPDLSGAIHHVSVLCRKWTT